jgi:hypothetical protein
MLGIFMIRRFSEGSGLLGLLGLEGCANLGFHPCAESAGVFTDFV